MSATVPDQKASGRAPPHWLWAVIAAWSMALIGLALISVYGQARYERRETLRYEFQTARADLARSVMEIIATDEKNDPYTRRAALARTRTSIEQMRAAVGRLGPDLGHAREVEAGLEQISRGLADGGAGKPLRGTLDTAYMRATPAFEAWLVAARDAQSDARQQSTSLFLATLAAAALLTFVTGAGMLRARAAWRRADARVDRLTRLRQAQSRINEALVRHADFATLAETVCRVAVDEGGLECAILRRFEPADQTLVPVAWYAPRTGIIGRRVAPLSEVQGISAVSFTRGQPVVVDEMSTNPITAHGAPAAARLGVHSAAAFPLSSEGRTFATLALFGPGRDFFDAEIVDLLRGTADSLSYAHAKIEAARALVESEARYRTLIHAAPEAIMVVTARGAELVNPAALAMFGYGPEGPELPAAIEPHLCPSHREQSLARLHAVLQDRAAQPGIETRYLRLDGSEIDVESITVPIEYGGGPAAMVIARDLTGQRAIEERLHRLAMLREAQSRINEAVVREADFAALAHAVCRIAVEIGGVKCALVRLHEPHRDLLLPLAFHGPETGLVGRQELPARGDRGVSAIAFQTAAPCVVHDMKESPLTAHAAPAGAAATVRSAAAFPLIEAGRVFGTFALFGPGAGYFDAEMTALLQETANTLAYAHGKLAAEAARAASEQDYRTLIEALPLAVGVSCDRRIVMMNSAGLRMLGYGSVEEIADRDMMELVHPSSRQDATRRLDSLLASGGAQAPHESVAMRRDGTAIPVETTSFPFEYHGRPAVVSIAQDLSERRRAERDLRLAQEAGRIGVVIVDAERGSWSGSRVAFDILGLNPSPSRPLAEFYRMLLPGDGGGTSGLAENNAGSATRTDTVYRIVRPDDGRTRWVRVATDVEPGEAPQRRRIGTVQDVTDIKEAELRVLRLSRLYAALSRTNEAVAREATFEGLASTACRIIIDEMGMASASIRRLDETGKGLVMAASAGTIPPQLFPARIPIDDPLGVAPLAVRERRRVVVRDLAGHAATRPYADVAAELGTRAVAAFPIVGAQGVAGVLSLSSGDAALLDEDNLDLIGEIADALGFAHAKYQSEAARRESEARMASIVGSAMDAIITCDELFRVVVFNEAASRVFGVPALEAIGMPIDRFIPVRFRAGHAASMRGFGAGEPSPRSMGSLGRVTGLRADGHEFPAEASISSAEMGGRRFYTVILRDITDRMASERRIGRLSGFYAALSRANEAITRVTNWRVLCDEVCRIIVENGKVRSAFIRMLDREGRSLVPLSGYGPQTTAADVGPVAVDGDHPVARAFREGSTRVNNDMIANPAYGGSPDEAARRAVNAVIVVPLVRDDSAIGTLSVFADETGHFDDELQRLMGDLAGDLAFAYGKLEAAAIIRESEVRYRTVVDTSPDAIRVICEGRVVMVNPAYERLFGEVAPGASFEETVLARLTPDSRRRAEERMASVIEERRIVPPEEQSVQRSDGVWLPIEATSAPFVYDGKPAAITIIRDLSDRKTRERALREAERRFRSLVENSLVGVAITFGGVYEYINPGLVAILGHASATDLIGRPALDTVLEEDRPGVSAAFRALEAEPGSRRERQRLRMRRADGRIIDVLSSAASIEVEGRVLVQAEVHDITDERRARAELEALNRELEDRVASRTMELTAANRNLESANRNLESFSYSVAHDLRAPLRNMSGFAGLLELDVADRQFDAIPQHAARIMQNANRMNALIDGLLAVARVTHGTLADAPVDMAALVAETVRDTHAGPNVRFEIGPLPVLRGDAATLRQVWINLIANAIKYSARVARPVIAIDQTSSDAECAFHVRDNGAGFDPAYADRLFGVFQRLHTAQEFDGTGVGLAIVRRIVERHGGRVWAEGRPGEGATFHFALPAARLLDRKPG